MNLRQRFINTAKIEISWYKGEMDAIVGYSGETVILWPYKSRIFSLSEIA